MALSSCGRAGPTRPPEEFAPREVEMLQVSGSVEGVKFSWLSPSGDRRGKRLESLEGYSVRRAAVPPPEAGRESDILDLDFEELAAIEDKSVATREQLREAARAEGKPARKIKVDKALSEFSFTDQTARPGLVYLYKIVPLNQGGVEGESKNLVRVVYRGEASEISLVNVESLFDSDAGVSIDSEGDA